MKNIDIRRLITNSVEIPENKKFCSIIGSNPSKGARSPLLWNKAFNEMNLNNIMIPLDCESCNINELLQALENHSFFKGGAIAAPFKEDVAKWLNNKITRESKKIGAVNCIFRNNQEELFGTNTDGEAAIFSMKNSFGPIKNKKPLIMGTGGTAKAIVAYLAPELQHDHEIGIVGNSFSKLEFHKLYKNTKAFLWEEIDKIIMKFNLIINCTTIGWDSQSSKSPISNNLFDLLSKESMIFDVIYDPNPTVFLNYAEEKGFVSLSGLDMNVEQAVLAFAKVNNLSDNLEEIKRHMISALKK